MFTQAILFRDDTSCAARELHYDQAGFLTLADISAYAELVDQGRPGDELTLVRHSSADCMCPDELGLRDGCVILHSITLS